MSWRAGSRRAPRRPRRRRWAASRLPERGLGFWLALWAAGRRRRVRRARAGHLPGDEQVETVQVVYRLIGGSFAACGLIAWHRRPDSRSGAADGRGRRRLLRLGASLEPDRRRRSRRPRRSSLQEIWAPFFVALVLTLLTGGRLDVAGRLAARGRLRARAVGPAGRLAAVLRAGRQPAGRLPERRHRRRGRQGQRSLAGLACVAVAVVVALRWTGGVAAAPPRAAAERRRQRRAAALRRAADQRPRDRLALADRPRGWRSARS